MLFAANGGTGSMTAERHTGPAALTPNDFRRSGYTFAEWNTRPNGSGTTYTNGARYSFGASTTLYAEWKKVTPTTPPFTVPGGVTIGEFARGSSSLSSGLKSQIQDLAHQIKTKSDTQVTLYGFGDEAASANAADLALGRQRAESVAWVSRSAPRGDRSEGVHHLDRPRESEPRRGRHRRRFALVGETLDQGVIVTRKIGET